MRPPKAFPRGSAALLQGLLRKAKTVADQRRIQAVLMRALDASPPEKIAALTGLRASSVRVLHSQFMRQGPAFLLNRPGRGGRRRNLLTDAQAKALLEKHTSEALQGRIVEAGVFKRDYEALVGRPVAATTVYRFLRRAGWRKIVPRPSHPRKAPQAEAIFKKGSRKR
jgi:transposase